MWVCHFRFELKVMLNKLISDTLSISILFIFISGYVTFLCGVSNTMYLVFLTFKDNLLAANHSLTLVNSVLIISSDKSPKLQ